MVEERESDLLWIDDTLPNNESEGVWIIALAWQSTVALIPFLLVGLIDVNRFGILVAVVSCSYFFLGLSCLLSCFVDWVKSKQIRNCECRKLVFASRLSTEACAKNFLSLALFSKVYRWSWWRLCGRIQYLLLEC